MTERFHIPYLMAAFFLTYGIFFGYHIILESFRRKEREEHCSARKDSQPQTPDSRLQTPNSKPQTRG